MLPLTASDCVTYLEFALGKRPHADAHAYMQRMFPYTMREYRIGCERNEWQLACLLCREYVSVWSVLTSTSFQKYPIIPHSPNLACGGHGTRNTYRVFPARTQKAVLLTLRFYESAAMMIKPAAVSVAVVATATTFAADDAFKVEYEGLYT